MKVKYLFICAIAITIFTSCDKNSVVIENNEAPEDESLIFNFHRFGGWTGLDEKLKITADSTFYSNEYYVQTAGMTVKSQAAVKTSKEQWAYLTKTFDWETFTKIQNGFCAACVDGIDVAFSVTKDDEIYSFFNGGGDEHFKQMQGFFDAIWMQASTFRMHFSPGSGCSSFLVYKIDRNHFYYYDTGIAVTGNREKLSLSETEQTFDLSKTNVQDLNVEVKKLTSDSHGAYCDCVFEGEVLDTWTSVSGTVKIRIVQDYEGDPEAFEKIHTINVTLEDVVLQNDKGNTIVVNRMEFSNVTVGWLPG